MTRRLPLLPVAIAVACTFAIPLVVAGEARAGCHLVDCVENVPIKASQLAGRSCEDLWVLRNSIFKDAGYCFKTARAIKWFGNAGCKYDAQSEVPLSDIMRNNVKVLAAAEAKQGC